MTEEILNEFNEAAKAHEAEENIAPSATDSEYSDGATDTTDGTPIIDELNARIESLTQELEAYKAAQEQQKKIAEQINEFSELFPNTAIKAIPDEVWESVKRGNSLAASYAIYEKRITEAARRIEEINARNATLSAGVAGKNSPSEYFSADEVRKMSPQEVRANFAKIRKSMEKWN